MLAGDMLCGNPTFFNSSSKADMSNESSSNAGRLERQRERRVDSKPSGRAVCSIHPAEPKDWPRVAERRNAANSASV